MRAVTAILTAAIVGSASGSLAASTDAAPPLPDKRYVGSSACGECHAAQHEAWLRSQHRRAMQIADAKTVLGDFRNARFTYAGTTSTFFIRDGRFFVRTDGPDGKLADFEIKYTFGIEPLQQYLIELPGGRLQALGIAWDTRSKAQGGQRWFHLYPGQNIRAGDPLHWTGVDQNWNFMCAECHTVDLRKNYDAQAGAFRTTWSELGVGCEACHGPGADHIGWVRAPRKENASGSKGLAIALDERKGVNWMPLAATGNVERSAPRTSSREIEMCARCHGRAARLSDDYVHGKPPLDTHQVALLDDALYWNDGQMRDEVYNYGSFVQSKMHAKGVTCSDCHDPHTQALRVPGNALCGQCHAPSKFDTEAHTHHAKGGAGTACTACHMPTTTYMQVDARHDHSFRLPRPDLSAKLGVPNACNNCHANKTPQWAADAIVKWNGKVPTGYQNFAEAFHAATLGAPGARDALRVVIEDSTQSALVRASAIDRLGRWLTPGWTPTVAKALRDPDPLVRHAAVKALGNADPATAARYLSPMVSDPVRSVRIEAARALAAAPENAIPAADRAAFKKALDEYIATQTYLADRPEGHLNLANLYALRGEPQRARAELEKALTIDPRSTAARVNLADLNRARGADKDAEDVLRKGIALDPRAAPLHYALGLTLVRQKRHAYAVREFAEAVKLAPNNARYAYVYAVALYDTGRQQDAVKLLEGALFKNPYDRDLLLALAQYANQRGQRDAAIGYAKTLRDVDPENQNYARLFAQLSGNAAK